MTKNKKRIIWIVIILAIITGIVFFVRSKKPVTTYTTENVKRGNLVQTVSETGTIKTVNQTDLSFKISGRVTKLLADVGDQVKAGQPLAELELGTLNSQLEQAKSDLKFQKETLDSMKRKKTQFNTDDKDAQRARINSAEAQIEAVESQIKDTKMFSPINGMILKRNVDQFETTVANSPTPVFTVGNPQDLVIETNVPESDILKIKLGQDAKVSFDALLATEIFDASVTEIDPASTVVQDVVNYRIKLKLVSPDARIKPGMSANIDVMTAEKDGVLMIPLRAVHTDGTQKYVDILLDAKNNLTERRNITLGLEGDGGLIEVATGNLKESEAVITFTK